MVLKFYYASEFLGGLVKMQIAEPYPASSRFNKPDMGVQEFAFLTSAQRILMLSV